MGIPEHATYYAFTDLEEEYLISLSDPMTALLALYRIGFGAEVYDNATSVDPNKFKIPRRLWLSLCKGEFNWIDIGPSTYD